MPPRTRPAGTGGREFLAFLPVADQLAVNRVADGRDIQFFQLLADLARRVVAVLQAGFHRFVLLQTRHPVLRIIGPEGGAEHLLGILGVLATRRLNSFLGESRGSCCYGQPEKKGKFEIHDRPLFQRLMPGVSMTVPVAVFCR